MSVCSYHSFLSKAVHFYVHGANWELCDALEGAEKGEQSGYV